MKLGMKCARNGLAAVLALATVASALSAQSSKGEAVAATITLGGAAPSQFARATLGTAEMREASVDAIRNARFVTELATAVTTGTLESAGATSIATVSNISLLDGLITAAGVIAVATATAAGPDATGSGFEDLRMRGVPVAGGGPIAPNTRVELPGVGYVIFNEQVVEGGAITVNMIRLVQTPRLGVLRTELVIASARSGQ
jgi:hypothetical protein